MAGTFRAMPALAPTIHALAGPGASAALLWWPPVVARMAASGPLGGGIGVRAWVVNVTVSPDYSRVDPDRHLEEIASTLNLAAVGVGMLTAVDVGGSRRADEGGVEVVVSVGLTWPTWAAAPDGAPNPYAGTVNTIAWLPVVLSDAALVGAVITATEAKTQALADAGVPGTGTASDAVCIACPQPAHGDALEPFAGPRSVWGARLARAVHAAVGAGVSRRPASSN